ncbi:hypothetical protein RIF29_12084 [Crotalaria pallida]|uniref:Epidermal patterning factor-like protein n=1 Tax=Crotalaria pallida TaxID=3830 RepID=A0AAN9IMW4_CROPI
MGRAQFFLCWHKYRQIIIIYFLILFASTSTFNNLVFMAQGRTISNLIEVEAQGMNERKMVMVVRAQIGSRPPKCEGRCRTCGHCEAVQVPIEPIVQKHKSHYSKAGAITISSSRSDDLSNYKPMSWKCKCGDYFFNP